MELLYNLSLSIVSFSDICVFIFKKNFLIKDLVMRVQIVCQVVRCCVNNA